MASLEGALATAHLTIVRHGERVDETAGAAHDREVRRGEGALEGRHTCPAALQGPPGGHGAGAQGLWQGR